MKITIWDRLRGFVVWSQGRDPRIKGPQPRVISIAAAEALQNDCNENPHEELEEENETV